MKYRKCRKCKNELFKVVIRTNCGDCPENGAYDEEDGYVYSESIIEEKGLIRDEVDNEGECLFGPAHGAGCYLHECEKCGAQSYMPLMDL